MLKVSTRKKKRLIHRNNARTRTHSNTQKPKSKCGEAAIAIHNNKPGEQGIGAVGAFAPHGCF